ncbi:MAG: hypothetical protein ACJAYL_002890, partial [Cryomorphaceae bacterium]
CRRGAQFGQYLIQGILEFLGFRPLFQPSGG